MQKLSLFKKILLIQFLSIALSSAALGQLLSKAKPANTEVNPVIDFKLLSKSVVYPEEAKLQKIEGKSEVQVLIKSDGKPSQPFIYKSSHPLLDSAAISAVMSVTYTPAYENGNPIAVWVVIPIKFELGMHPTNPTTPKKETPVTEPK